MLGRAPRLARDHGGERLDTTAWSREVIVTLDFDRPAAEVFHQLVATEKIVLAGREHIQICRAFNEHIHDRTAAGADMSVYVRQQFECTRSAEEHQEADRDNGIVVARNAEIAKISHHGIDRHALIVSRLANPRDASGAAVDCRYSAATALGLKCQVSQPTTQVEHIASDVIERRLLERI